MRQIGNSAPKTAATGKQGAAFAILLLYFFFEYVRPQSGGLLPILQPFKIPMLLTIMLLFIFLGSSKRMIQDRLVQYVVAFILLIGFSVTYAPNTYHVWGVFKDMMVILICVIMVMPEVCDSRERLDKFLYLWVFYNCLLAVYAITHGGHGPSGFLWDENDLALALNMCIPIPFYLWLRAKDVAKRQANSTGAPPVRGQGRPEPAADSKPSGRFRLLMLSAVILLVIGSGATMSRGGFIGIVAVFGTIWLLSGQKLKSLATLLLYVAIAGYPVYMLVPEKYKTEMSTITDENDNTRGDRLEFWGYGWEMFLDNPVLGVGAMNFPWTVHIYQMRKPDYDPDRVTLYGGRPAHSLYFTLIPELGLAGIVIFVLILAQVFGKLRRIILKAKEHEVLCDLGIYAKSMLVSTVAYLITGAFISVLYYPPFWYLIAAVLTLDQIAAKEIEYLAVEGRNASESNSHHRNRGAGRGREYSGTDRKRIARRL